MPITENTPNIAPVIKETVEVPVIPFQDDSQPAPNASTAPNDPNAQAAPKDAPEGSTEPAKANSETPSEEASQEQKQPEAKDNTKLSARFAELTRRENELRQREQQVKQLKSQVDEFEKAKQNAKQDPFTLLKAAGWTWDNLVNHVIQHGEAPRQPDPTSLLEQKIKEIEEKTEALRKHEEEQRAKAEQENTYRAIQQYQNNVIKPYIEQNAEKYELTMKQYGDDLPNQITLAMDQHFRATGKFISAQEVLDRSEAVLEDAARKILETKKFKSAIPSNAGENIDETPNAVKETTVATKTLTNKLTPSTSVGQTKRKLSREERLREAAKLIKWND